MQVQESDVYRRIRLLGKGAYGKAYLAESYRDKDICVIKQIDISFMAPEEVQIAYKEAKIMSTLRHPNIIHFREVYKTKKGKLCLVMDYADGGDLAQKLKNSQGSISEEQVLDWFTQLCLAVKHCHERKVLHRDIKTSNIFLTTDGRVKLGDFGISKILSCTSQYAKSVVGTPYYMAPELVEHQPYGLKSDIWALGIVLYEMCQKQTPFQAENIASLALKIVKGDYIPVSDNYSKELKTLIGRLLSTKQPRRPTVLEILRERIIRDRCKTFLTETQLLKQQPQPRNSVDKKSPEKKLPELKKRRVLTPRKRISPSLHKLPDIAKSKVLQTPDLNKRVYLNRPQEIEKQQTPKKSLVSEGPETPQQQILKSPSLQSRIFSGRVPSERNFMLKKQPIKPFIRQQSSKQNYNAPFFSPKKELFDRNKSLESEEDKQIEEIEIPLTLTKSNFEFKKDNISQIKSDSSNSIEDKKKKNKIIYKDPFKKNEEEEVQDMLNQITEIAYPSDDEKVPKAQIIANDNVRKLRANLVQSKLGRHYDYLYTSCKSVLQKTGDLGKSIMVQIIQTEFKGVSKKRIDGIATLILTLLLEEQGEAINTNL